MVYLKRRERLMALLPPHSVAIISASSEIYRNGDTHYRFRQQSDFYYLTGFNEPDAILVIQTSPYFNTILFNRERDKTSEQWTGRRLGQEDAPMTLNIDRAYPIEAFKAELPQLLMGFDHLYFDLNGDKALQDVVLTTLNTVKSKVRQGIKAPQAIFSLHELIANLRLFKTEDEIALLQKAADISVKAHQKVMQYTKPGRKEYELEGLFVGEILSQGCRSVAYDCIVGGGENACVLHYTDNNETLNDGDMVLIDAGGEYQNYAADITRTFPVNGRFSKPQRALYEVVLKAQQEAIKAIKPGLLWNEIQNIIVHHLTKGLIDLNILKGPLESLIEAAAYKAYYMHSSGHWLGLDVHDVGQYKINNEWRTLAPGMVLTVEPGLYIPIDDEDVPEVYRGIGIRIEDDILVTKDGHQNLTAALPVCCDDIEALMSGN